MDRNQEGVVSQYGPRMLEGFILRARETATAASAQQLDPAMRLTPEQEYMIRAGVNPPVYENAVGEVMSQVNFPEIMAVQRGLTRSAFARRVLSSSTGIGVGIPSSAALPDAPTTSMYSADFDGDAVSRRDRVFSDRLEVRSNITGNTATYVNASINTSPSSWTADRLSREVAEIQAYLQDQEYAPPTINIQSPVLPMYIGDSVSVYNVCNSANLPISTWTLNNICTPYGGREIKSQVYADYLRHAEAKRQSDIEKFTLSDRKGPPPPGYIGPETKHPKPAPKETRPVQLELF